MLNKLDQQVVIAGGAVITLVIIRTLSFFLVILISFLVFIRQGQIAIPGQAVTQIIRPTATPTVVATPLVIVPDFQGFTESEWSANLRETPVVPSQPEAALTQPSNPVVEAPLPTAVIPAIASTPENVLQPERKPVLVSPLQGIAIKDLSTMVSKSFEAPPPGMDSGHHGVDFAFWRRGNQPSILGLTVNSILSGIVAGETRKDTPPYGFVVLIETPLSSVSPDLIQQIKLPSQTLTDSNNTRLVCPTNIVDTWNNEAQSLYVLYAHLGQPPQVLTGDSITQGQSIGQVGNTGYSTGPHLHLEMRIGPSGARFEGIGHYDGNTTDIERHNYCNWRISGIFQLFDPMSLFSSNLVTQ